MELRINKYRMFVVVRYNCDLNPVSFFVGNGTEKKKI